MVRSWLDTHRLRPAVLVDGIDQEALLGVQIFLGYVAEVLVGEQVSELRNKNGLSARVIKALCHRLP